MEHSVAITAKRLDDEGHRSGVLIRYDNVPPASGDAGWWGTHFLDLEPGTHPGEAGQRRDFDYTSKILPFPALR
jgi:hypothetical protein